MELITFKSWLGNTIHIIDSYGYLLFVTNERAVVQYEILEISDTLPELAYVDIKNHDKELAYQVCDVSFGNRVYAIGGKAYRVNMTQTVRYRLDDARTAE